MTTEFRYYEVLHDPYRKINVGTRLTVQRIWELLEDDAGNGLEVTDGVQTFRLYRGSFYRLESGGQMRLWPLPNSR